MSAIACSSPGSAFLVAPSLVNPGRFGAGAVFGSLARVLQGRPLHPVGVAFDATLSVTPPGLEGTELFGRDAVWQARVRFSRGFGLPEPLPEILSMAIKVPDAYGAGRDHDLLLTASGRGPVARHLFSGGRSHLARSYSSVLPFRAGGETVVFGAVPLDPPRGVAGGDLDELVAAAAVRRLAFAVQAATPLGSWRTLARLDVGRRLTEAEERALAFNSDAAGGGIEPIGAINRIRGGAYAAAAAARPRPSVQPAPRQRAPSR
jgi:hypothetical protein